MIARITTPPSAEATPHSEKVAGLSCRYPTGLLPLGNKKGKVIDHFHGEGLPDLGLEPAEKAAALNHVLKKKQDPTEPSLENHIESENVETQKAVDSQGAVPAGQEPSRILRRSIRLHASKGAAFEISGRGACGSKRSGEDDPDGKLDRHSRSEKLALLTSRASKRLAGLEPDPTVDIEVGDRSLKRGRPSTRSRSRLVPSPFSDIRDLAADPPKFEDGSPGGRVGSADHAGAGDTAAEFAVTSPFGDRWPDPCIEFAFKTLTGQIPVPEAAAIGDYFCEWLSPPPAAADGAPTPPEVPEKSLFPPS
ncbi:unnamed protein product [Spirodela intermedia]|uniref:Uncharacterized protein n=1 Tax=Spirodela intermedia TaxID=51605 RepID=A0A7I8LKG7_SPIIN|nr:unnamed protein product [Spirodela intermedia]